MSVSGVLVTGHKQMIWHFYLAFCLHQLIPDEPMVWQSNESIH